MNITETYRITELLRRTFDGEPWYGPSVMDTLSDVTLEETLNQLPDSHTVAELVEHMIAWRTFAIKRLQGDTEFDVNQEASFVKISAMTSELWRDMLQRLQQTQEALLQILSQISDEKLAQIVAGRDYTFDRLLHGVIHHDIYHSGQIVLLRKM
ncbi:MAG: DinB family protein [Saprospiraceae bacterium]